jgi:hypothetical protein
VIVASDIIIDDHVKSFLPESVPVEHNATFIIGAFSDEDYDTVQMENKDTQTDEYDLEVAENIVEAAKRPPRSLDECVKLLKDAVSLDSGFITSSSSSSSSWLRGRGLVLKGSLPSYFCARYIQCVHMADAHWCLFTVNVL